MTETAFIGFGSNLGDRIDFCDRAVALLGLLPQSHVVAVSSLYETEPVANATEPGTGWFLNGVVQLRTTLTAQHLLAFCQEIERALGRDPERRSGPRTMDLDILFYGNHIIEEQDFIVPHPRLHQRRFVLEPLVELAPGFVHPVSKQTVSYLLAQLADPHQVRRLTLGPGQASGSCSSWRRRA